MRIQRKELNQHQLELIIRVSKADAQPMLLKTASRLSEQRPIKGFRPGKAPYDIVKRQFGEETILKESLEDIINESFSKVLQDENLFTYGQVGFDLLPAEADDAVAYKTLVTLMPTVKLGKWQDKKIKPALVVVSDEELSQALDELAGMTSTEEPSSAPAKMGDKAVVDFEVSIEGKVIDGGTAQDFELILGEGRMIPGFEEKVVGSKAGDKLEFDLNFPEKYHATQLAGKPAKFKVTVKQVLARNKPTIDDEFAKRVGLANVQQLKDRLQENIAREKHEKEMERVEIAAIKQLVDSATYSEIPDIMIKDTVADIVHDFEHTLAHQGMKMAQYLQSVNKTLEQVKKDFEPKAIERIKASMAMGQLAEDDQITLTQEEIEAGLKDHMRQHDHGDHQHDHRRYVANQLMNRKLINHLKVKIVDK